MIVNIYHAKNPDFRTLKSMPDLDGFEPVATMTCEAPDAFEACEKAYCQSQNIHEAWRDPPCRSTSVGDMMVIGQDVYAVASFGFDHLGLLS